MQKINNKYLNNNVEYRLEGKLMDNKPNLYTLLYKGDINE